VSRLIQMDRVGTERDRLCKLVNYTVRSLAAKQEIDVEAKDMLAFIIICLKKITATIDQTVAAWEKRDYWIKADRFKQSWLWVDTHQVKLLNAYNTDDWGLVAVSLADIGMKLSKVKIPVRKSVEKPWEDARKQLANL
jgi:hypothetical protein